MEAGAGADGVESLRPARIRSLMMMKVIFKRECELLVRRHLSRSRTIDDDSPNVPTKKLRRSLRRSTWAAGGSQAAEQPPFFIRERSSGAGERPV